MQMPTAADFQTALDEKFQTATQESRSYIDVISGDLHRRVGSYPQRNHRMPVCCDVMQRNMHGGDHIVAQPSKGKGATLTVRYRLPRP